MCTGFMGFVRFMGFIGLIAFRISRPAFNVMSCLPVKSSGFMISTDVMHFFAKERISNQN